jgi:catechol 2,3-dioxygenase-like lactoylglutathione lyase family enzyme
MGIRRVVPDIESERFDESRAFYVDVLGFEVGMEMDWVMTFVSPTNPTAQVILISEDASAPVTPQMSVEVDDVDAVHAEAVRQGVEIVHPLTDERHRRERPVPPVRADGTLSQRGRSPAENGGSCG